MTTNIKKAEARASDPCGGSTEQPASGGLRATRRQVLAALAAGAAAAFPGARRGVRHRLQLQSRTPRLAFRGPGFIAPLVGRTRRLSALAGCGGGLVAVREVVGPQNRAAADVHLPG
jgi:hypothetical protein